MNMCGLPLHNTDETSQTTIIATEPRLQHIRLRTNEAPWPTLVLQQLNVLRAVISVEMSVNSLQSTAKMQPVHEHQPVQAAHLLLQVGHFFLLEPQFISLVYCVALVH
eukprot:SAG31_NODE_542_length_14269_cov_7.826253_4_plen_108_part_00